MKNILPLRFLLSSIIALSLFAGCTKPIKDPFNADGTVPCLVQKIIIPSGALVASNAVKRTPYIAQRIPYKVQHTTNIAPAAGDTLTFTYNTLGNPVSATHQMDIGDNLLFKYDNLNRLTDYVNIFPSNTAGDYWHKYTYDGPTSNRIIADTAFRDFISSNGQLIDYNDIDLTVFKYDKEGRISQSTEYVLGDTIVRSFTYDANGDLQGNGSIYDAMLNIHRTNTIWMFIDRDYSINNPVDNGSDTYNSVGLPISISTNNTSVPPGFTFIIIGYPFGITNASIVYSCP